jgi:hypothetical protein
MEPRARRQRSFCEIRVARQLRNAAAGEETERARRQGKARATASAGPRRRADQFEAKQAYDSVQTSGRSFLHSFSLEHR